MNKPESIDPFLPSIWKLAHGREIELGPRAVLMGIVNVTPDSFSDGGLHWDRDAAIRQARALHEQGAAIIDIGGESTRPGADPVTAAEEQDRVLPVIEALSKESGLVLSVDTWHADTARLAIQAGAHIVNDVSGLAGDESMAALIAETGAGCIAMHNGRGLEKLADVIEDQIALLSKCIARARKAGIASESLLLDPGFGFAKDVEYNITLLARLEEVLALGYHFVTGTSRKRFIGHFTGRDASDRDIGTVATSVVARMKGSAVLRVHDVAANADALAIADALLEAAGRVRRA